MIIALRSIGIYRCGAWGPWTPKHFHDQEKEKKGKKRKEKRVKYDIIFLMGMPKFITKLSFYIKKVKILLARSISEFLEHTPCMAPSKFWALYFPTSQ